MGLSRCLLLLVVATPPLGCAARNADGGKEEVPEGFEDCWHTATKEQKEFCCFSNWEGPPCFDRLFTKEIGELKKLIQNYMKEESVKEIRLQDNNLDKSAVPLLCEMMDLCPYLTKLDLRRNRLDNDALADLQGFVERIPGVTTLVKDPVTGDLRARSGNQVRLVILLEDQSPPDPDAPPSPTADLTEDQAGMAADGFLASAAGVTSQGRLQGPDGPSGGTTRTMAMPQKPGGAGKPLGDGTATTLPPI